MKQTLLFVAIAFVLQYIYRQEIKCVLGGKYSCKVIKKILHYVLGIFF